MIHGYHVIFGAYGFWLPNDPRGSWSEFVASWELVRFGKTTKGFERLALTIEQERQRDDAKRNLIYPPVIFTGTQARAIARGFAKACEKSNLTLWACSLLPEHIHAVVGRHRFKVEYVVGLLKGEATKQLNRESLHPLAKYRNSKGEIPTPWNSRCWRTYLDTEEGIDNTIQYVQENPEKEGKRRQNWNFVKAFTGLDQGWVTYHDA